MAKNNETLFKIKDELFGRPEDALCVKRCLVVLAILENIFF